MGMNWRGSKPIQQVGSQRLAKSLSKRRLTSNFILGSAPAKNPNKGRENNRADVTATPARTPAWPGAHMGTQQAARRGASALQEAHELDFAPLQSCC